MKKSLKIVLICLSVLISVIILDTLQARLFKNSPLISIKEELSDDSYVDRGIIIDTFYCVKERDIITVSWHFKTAKFTCPKYNKIDENEINNNIKNDTYTSIIIDSKEMKILQSDYNILKNIFSNLDYNKKCEKGNEEYIIEIENDKTYNKYYYYRWNNTVGNNNVKCANIDGDNLYNADRILNFTYSDNEMNNIENVSIVIKDGTLTKTGATIIITDTNKKHYEYGMPFRIDKKEDYGWRELKITGNGAFNLPAYIVDKNNKLELNQNWEHIYGELESGEYRLVKYVCVNDGCTKKKYFSVEFNIE